MKKYEVYRNIRKQALLFGLPVTLFAIQMIAIVASLLAIIFSFSFGLILVVLFCNAGLYLFLVRIVTHPISTTLGSVLPKYISNKQSTNNPYEEH